MHDKRKQLLVLPSLLLLLIAGFGLRAEASENTRRSDDLGVWEDPEFQKALPGQLRVSRRGRAAGDHGRARADGEDPAAPVDRHRSCPAAAGEGHRPRDERRLRLHDGQHPLPGRRSRASGGTLPERAGQVPELPARPQESRPDPGSHGRVPAGDRVPGPRDRARRRRRAHLGAPRLRLRVGRPLRLGRVGIPQRGAARAGHARLETRTDAERAAPGKVCRGGESLRGADRRRFGSRRPLAVAGQRLHRTGEPACRREELRDRTAHGGGDDQEPADSRRHLRQRGSVGPGAAGPTGSPWIPTARRPTPNATCATSKFSHSAER